MSLKSKYDPGIGQEPLFDLGEIYPTINNLPTQGLSIDKQIRAYHLLRTLDLLGNLHRLTGFGIATSPDEDSGSKDKIIARYGNGKMAKIRENSLAKQGELLNQAKWQFVFASGWMALKGAGFDSEESIKQMALDDFIAFDATHFGDNQAVNNRRRFRNQLKKQQNNV